MWRNRCLKMHINGWYWTHGTFKSSKIGSQHLFRVGNGVDYALLCYLRDIGCSVTFLQSTSTTHGCPFLALINLLLLRKCFCVTSNASRISLSGIKYSNKRMYCNSLKIWLFCTSICVATMRKRVGRLYFEWNVH